MLSDPTPDGDIDPAEAPEPTLGLLIEPGAEGPTVRVLASPVHTFPPEITLAFAEGLRAASAALIPRASAEPEPERPALYQRVIS